MAKELQIKFHTVSGINLEKTYVEHEILPEQLRGQIQIPPWLEKARREELPEGVLVLRGNVEFMHEAEAAEWMGLK